MTKNKWVDAIRELEAIIELNGLSDIAGALRDIGEEDAAIELEMAITENGWDTMVPPYAAKNLERALYRLAKSRGKYQE